MDEDGVGVVGDEVGEAMFGEADMRIPGFRIGVAISIVELLASFLTKKAESIEKG
jgi:hypothetical protein